MAATNEGSETLVFSTKSKASAENLRKELLQNFSRVWVYVFNMANQSWEVKVASNWGGRLDKATLTEVEAYVKNTKKKSKSDKDDNKPKSD
jgi:hypothetical protein